MALLVSSNDFIKTNESAIRTQIQASLDMMDSKQLEEFGKNVASLVDLVNESAQQALSRITTGYYTEEENARAVDEAKFQANLGAFATQQDAKKAEDEAKQDEKQYTKWLKSIYDEINLRKDIVRDLKDKLKGIKPVSYYQKAITDLDELSTNFKTQRNPIPDPRYDKIDEKIPQIRYRLERLGGITGSVRTTIESLLSSHTTSETGLLALLEKQAKNAERMKDESQREDAGLKNKQILDRLKNLYFSKIRPLELALNRNEQVGINLFKEYKTLYSDVIKQLKKIHDEQKNVSVPKESTIDKPTTTKVKESTYIEPAQFMTTCKFKVGDKVSIINPVDVDEQGIFEIFGLTGPDDGSCGVLTLAKVYGGGLVEVLATPKTVNDVKLEPQEAVTREVPVVGAEGQPQFAAQGSQEEPVVAPVVGEAVPAEAPSGPVVGAEVPVAAPEAPAAPAVEESVEGEAAPVEQRNIHADALAIARRSVPTDRQSRQGYINELTREIETFRQLRNTADSLEQSRIDYTIRNLSNRITDVRTLMGGRSSYRRRMKKKGRKTFRRHK